MPEETLICEDCHRPITDLNWGTETRPLCIGCWSELVDLADVFERETDLEVERRR